MNASRFLAALVASIVVLSAPARAEIIGAGSGSTGGTIDGKTNESGTSMKTGADNGQEPVTSGNGTSGNGTGDNAVLNAPGEPVPRTKAGSQPSNLNGQ